MVKKNYIIASVFFILFLGSVTLFIFNIANPKYFRYFTVKCKVGGYRCIPINNTHHCTYVLIYNELVGIYEKNCDNNCDLPSKLNCEIKSHKDHSQYLLYVKDNDILTSNIINMVLLLCPIIVFIVFGIDQIRKPIT
jgi:hypothetical protein